MFAYSLSGLELTEDSQQVTEVEENEITARSATYQVLGRLFTFPDDDHFEMARSGQWAKELEEAGALLDFDYEIGDIEVPGELDKDVYTGEFERLFLVDRNGGKRIWSGTYVDDRDQTLTELARAYEYYGLGGADDGDVPLDHLASELDFMQFLTFKEAAASSPRLGKSFRRAQGDFLGNQLASWLPEFVSQVRADQPLPFFEWMVGRLESFVAADAETVAG